MVYIQIRVKEFWTSLWYAIILFVLLSLSLQGVDHYNSGNAF